MKKKLKQRIAGTISFTVITCMAAAPVSAYAANVQSIQSAQKHEVRKVETESHAQLASYTGIVQDISDFGNEQNMKIITLKTLNDALTRFVISEDTYLVDEFEQGSEIIAYYDTTAPVFFIYPPRFDAKIIALAEEGRSFKVDHFQEKLISSDGMLRLNVSDKTVITAEDGSAYTGELTNRNLIVKYGASTRSIPAQTTPDLIIVLEDKQDAVKKFDLMNSTAIHQQALDKIIVHDKAVEAPAAFINDQSQVMVPLRAVAEALGYKIDWNQESQQIKLDQKFTMTIGTDQYVDMENSTISLGAAPTLVNHHTFVPLTFFTEVIKVNADLSEAGMIFSEDIVKFPANIPLNYNKIEMTEIQEKSNVTDVGEKQQSLPFGEISGEPVAIDLYAKTDEVHFAGLLHFKDKTYLIEPIGYSHDIDSIETYLIQQDFSMHDGTLHLVGAIGSPALGYQYVFYHSDNGEWYTYHNWGSPEAMDINHDGMNEVLMIFNGLNNNPPDISIIRLQNGELESANVNRAFYEHIDIGTGVNKISSSLSETSDSVIVIDLYGEHRDTVYYTFDSLDHIKMTDTTPDADEDTNDHNKASNTEIMKSLENKFVSAMQDQSYGTISDVETHLTEFMSDELAAKIMQDFFKEENGNVSKIERDAPLWINFDDLYSLEEVGANKFQFKQEHRSALRGQTILVVEYELQGDDWMIVDRYIERFDPEKAQHVPPTISGMEQEFKSNLLAPTDSNNRVPAYASLENVRNTLMTVMTQEMAETYVDIYYREEADGIYLVSTSAPLWIDFNESFEVTQTSDDIYVLTQEHDSMLYGHVELKVTYERFADQGWLMTERKSIPLD